MSAPTPIRAHVADITLLARQYAYEASSAYIDGQTLHATVRRYKTYDGVRRYYGPPKDVVWPLRTVHVSWTNEAARVAVAA